MSLEEWKKNGWLKEHRTSPQEIANLFAIVRRDLTDAKAQQVSADWRFGIAYNAALKLCTILLYASGYKPERALQHYRAIQSLPLILGNTYKEEAKYLDTCRNKRNAAEYDYVGVASADDVDELIDFVKELRATIIKWLEEKHPQLLIGRRK